MDLIEIDKSYHKLLNNIHLEMNKLQSTENIDEKEKIKGKIDRDLFYMKFLSIEAKGFDKEISHDIYKCYINIHNTLYEPSKHNNFKSIEKDIKMLHGIFDDIHTMVHQQSEKLNVIEDNISITENKIEKATKELETIPSSIKAKVLTFMFFAIATVTGISFIK